MEEQNKKKGCLLAIVISLITIVGVFCIIFVLPEVADRINNPNKNNTNKDTTPKLFTRNARNSDIDININEDFSLSISCIITPNVNIDNLQIKFTFVDKNKSTITTKNKVMGNVSSDTDYSVTFSLSEFTVTEFFKLYSMSAEVIGGTVSYFE